MASRRLHYTGWQQVDVWIESPVFGDPGERFVAREQTLYALRDRGLITLGKDGVQLTDAGKGRMTDPRFDPPYG
jgi:hypothetical protein